MNDQNNKASGSKTFKPKSQKKLDFSINETSINLLTQSKNRKRV